MKRKMITIEDVKKDLGGTHLIAYHEFKIDGLYVCHKFEVDIAKSKECVP